MSGTLLVHYSDGRGRLVLLNVRPDMTAREVLQRLISAEDGYTVLAVDGQVLYDNQLLSEAGVHAGSRLTVEVLCTNPPIPLYGCPTARELPGAVPACMLSTFEGFDTTEL